MGGVGHDGYFGVRAGATPVVHSEIEFGNVPGYRLLTVRFNRGSLTDVTVFDGFWSPGSFSWIMIDDLQMVPIS